MKTLHLIPVLALLLTSCGRSDEQLSREIAGTWQQGYRAPVVMSIGADGSFSSVTLYQNSTFTWSGTWEIKKGVFVISATKSNDIPIHSVERCKIVKLSDSALTCQIDYLTNKIVTYKRWPENRLLP